MSSKQTNKQTITPRPQQHSNNNNYNNNNNNICISIPPQVVTLQAVVGQVMMLHISMS